MMTFWRWAL